jgi:soluble lytic murein transglycosylase-like protein
MTLLRIEPANPLHPALIRRRSALGTIGALSVAGRASVGGLGILFGGLSPRLVIAGAQQEEPLIDSVRTALSSSVASAEPPEPVFATSEARLHYIRWKVEMNQRLVQRKSDLRTLQERTEFLQTVWYNCKRSRLDVDVVMGLIQVESNFRKRAISSVGARGFMQVMPFWTRVLADGDANRLFDMHTNLRFGCVIMRHYLDREQGDMFMALGRYNGSRGKSQYPNAVLGARKAWEFSA